ncbi:MAG: SpoIID/LytB domain-containing protein [Suilimivivens sp.]
MRTRIRIAFKLLLIVVCAICFLLLLKKDTGVFRLEQPKGEGIAAGDVVILMQAFLENTSINDDASQQLKEWLKYVKSRYVEMEREEFLYGDYIEMVKLLSEDKKFEMKEKYNDDFYLLKEDWYESYDMLLELYGLRDKITLTELSLLTGGNNLFEEATGNVMDENCLISADGKIYLYESEALPDYFFSKVNAYICGDVLLTVKQQKKDMFTLSNVWIMEADESKIQFFFNGYEINYRFQQDEAAEDVVRESVADLVFEAGKLKKTEKKNERINGRLLQISKEELELQDKGTYKIDKNCKMYQLYEELREAELTDLRIGYDFADYVIEDGKICAILIMRKENMESIRVAIMNSGFKSLYHDSIELTADCETELIYGPYTERETKLFQAGEEIKIDSESNYLEGDRIELVPSVKSGKIQVFSIDRSQGAPQYRGKMEVVKTNQGLVLINEVLLEEYLYSVVPSEMPASYPSEALKAQAVCARTYAYRYLIHPGIPEIGANVDDSVNYQVYNNIAENVNATKAVKETTGTLLYYGEEPVSTYYYSTSCGFGTDAGIWSESNKEDFPYLVSTHISESCEDDNVTPLEMMEEEVFCDYILSFHEEDYEKEEPWYRWEYDVKELDVEMMAGKLEKEFEKIYDISITKRREGGVADVLTLETDEGTIEVTGEYNIRYILNNGGKVIRQDGMEVENGMLLPSAYMIINVVKEEESVIGYTIFGGGYGHGVGMSQNGAKAMGNTGKNCEEILCFFYPDCYMIKMY